MLNFSRCSVVAGNDHRVMTVSQMIELFSVEGLSKKPRSSTQEARVDDGQHLSLLAAQILEPVVTPAIVESGLSTREQLIARKNWFFATLWEVGSARSPNGTAAACFDKVVRSSDAAEDSSWRGRSGAARGSRVRDSKMAASRGLQDCARAG